MRNINVESGIALPVAKEIVEIFYSNKDYDTINNELERVMQIIEFAQEKGIGAEKSIGLLHYVSTVAAHARPHSNELNSRGGRIFGGIKLKNTVCKENKYTLSVKQENDNDALISLKLTVIGLNGVENAAEIERAFLSYYKDLCAIAEKISS